MEPTVLDVKSTHTTVSGFMTQVFGLMSVGLVVTAAVALMLTTNIALIVALADYVFLIFLLELVIVFAISGAINRLSTPVAVGLFMIYAILNGLFFGIVLMAYAQSTVALAFAATAGTFILMAGYGAVTKQDLTRWGNLAIMGIFGLILGFIINFFLASSTIDWILTYVGIAIFIVLIAYDTQRLKNFAEQAEHSGNAFKFAVLGALSLYLDFINLFLRLLSVFGGSRR